MPRFIGTRCGVNSTDAPEVHLHLGGVPVIEQAVRRHVLVDGTERGRRLRWPAGAGHSRHGVDDDAGRSRRPRRGPAGRAPGWPPSGSSPGAAMQSVERQLVAVQLRQPVDEPVEELGLGVGLAVPPLVGRRRRAGGSRRRGRPPPSPDRRRRGRCAGWPRGAGRGTLRPRRRAGRGARTGNLVPVVRAARLGYRSATAVPACVSPVANRTSRSGWSAHRRSSSAPVKPDAPMIPMEAIRVTAIAELHADYLHDFACCRMNLRTIRPGAWPRGSDSDLVDDAGADGCRSRRR